MSKGLSGVKTLTASEIAKKWNLPLSVVAKKIAAGIKVEKEHTTSTRQANEIARDHLGERPDYYDKLHKMEKTKVVKEETGVSGVRGLGYVTGDPGVDPVQSYIDTNALAYDPFNGAKLELMKKIHNDLHNKKIGFKEFDSTKIKSNSNKDLSESLGSDYGTSAIPVIGDLTGSPRKVAKVDEDLRKWFRDKWVRFDTKGNIKGPCAREEGEGKPKCRSLSVARSMSKQERAKAARRKRREDPVADRPGKGGKPIMVKTYEETLLEKNVPTNPELWARAKAQAKSKFDVYPSAYANGWAAKWYKSKGGGWRTAANESIEEACWDTHKQQGMKKKGDKMVPNCVPKEEKNIVPANSTERGIYETDAADETNMAKSQLKAIGAKSTNLVSNLKGSKNLPAWVQSKIAVAKDGITAVDDYMTHSDRKLDEKWSKKYKDSIDCSNPKGFSQKAHCDGKKKLDELKAATPERVGKVHLRYLEQKKPVPDFVRNAVIKQWLKSKVGELPEKEKEQPKKQVKEYIEPYFVTAHKEGEGGIRKRLGGRMSQSIRANKPDAGLHPGAKGMLDKTIYETKEITMDTKELIDEALDNILEENLSEMKDNLMQALQEKAMEKLEERKKIISAQYFAQ